ncbi:MAG: GtrA family protein [Candidatus Nanoarchaeia archaeon]|nr:GtrA family protein [Candidatus Nanoarchaeia archaeon]
MIKIPDKWKLIWFHVGNFICWSYELLATLFLTEVSRWWYGISYAFALVTSIMFLFVFYVYFVFEVKGDRVRRLRNFTILTSIVYATSWFWVVLLTEKLHFYYPWSIMTVGLTIALFTFHLHEHMVFYD